MIYNHSKGEMMNADSKDHEALKQAVKEVVREEFADTVRPGLEALRKAHEELQETKDRLEEIKRLKSKAVSNSE